MRVLLTNDDGISSKGLEALTKAFQRIAEVTVVAPEGEKSGAGHSITVMEPLRVTRYVKKGNFFGYAVNGTPADCVKLSLKALLKKLPHLVVSGINPGLNTGTNVLYSGTVSAATEATLLGLPALAVSLQDNGKRQHFEVAARYAVKVALQVKKNGLPKGILLNINVPNLTLKKIKGIAITRQGVFKYTDFYEKRFDPRRRAYYWLTAEKLKLTEAEDSDMRAIENCQVSVTPLHYDMTRYEFISNLKKWEI